MTSILERPALSSSSPNWAGLHMKSFLNADGIERVLLPQTVRFSMSRFLRQSFVACNMVAASQSHFPDYSLIIQCMAPFLISMRILTIRLTWVLYCMYEPVSTKHHTSSLCLQRSLLHFLYQIVFLSISLSVLTCCHVILFSVCKNYWVFPFIPYLEFHRRASVD